VELGRIAEDRDALADAEAWYRRALRNTLRQLNPYSGAEAVYALASVSLRRGDAEGAATLLGTAHLLSGPVRPLPEDLAAAVRSAAGPAYDDAYERGRQMEPEALRAFVSGV